MGEVTRIEWADADQATGRKLGAQKSAAKKCGCTLHVWRERRAAGERWCYRCSSWKQGVVFSKDSARTGGLAPICKPCNSQRATRSRYGLSEAEFERLAAGGACPICARTGVPMEVDHDHSSGAVRAILCSRCNSGLGMFCDDPDLMGRAATYLRSHGRG